MDNAVIYALHTLGLKPNRWDSGGWYNFAKEEGILDKLNPSDETLPKNSAEFNKLSALYVAEMQKPAMESVCSLNADEFVGLPQDKMEKRFKSWITTCESRYFPAYVEALNINIKKYLEKNFRFKYSVDGKRIIYVKADTDAANIWEEVPDSEHPFSKLQGRRRSELKAVLVTHTQSKEVDVYYKGDDKTAPCVETNYPFYKLYKKHREEFVNTITGTNENVKEVIEKFDDYVDTLKRKHCGNLLEWEIKRGLSDIVGIMEDMDLKVDDYSFLYNPDFEPTDLTNDSETPAYAYFNLDTLVSGPTPDFDGFMDAVVPACRDMFMAAVFATVFASSLLNQYIWIHGEGGDGKTSFLQALMKFLGDRLCCSLGQTMSSEFGLENAVGKRMIVLSDVKTGLSVKSQLIHNLTGHDPVSINRKNRPIITKTLEPVVWIAANEAPDVNFDNRNEARRCLYIKMQEPSVEIQKKFYFTDKDGNFVLDSEGRKINNGYELTEKLLKEMPHILYKCKQAFERVCPSPYHVIKPTTEASHLAEENCVDIDANTWKTYLMETFEFTGNTEDCMLVTDVLEAVQETKDSHSDRTQMNQFVKRDVKRLLTTAFGCCNKVVHGTRYLSGLKRKQS